ncbi:hypothetical protein O6H91_08G096500 [Diphasiastrum complanatum]|nr:hypothetical protein O6H91_08G096500 [Diphasiastrum complanatum]KAJ7547640.1 hypothetical protein O6H91_08G096500 [Diphasiastrum complanatum]KAJ7547641.1 hypothetical protein O6H91_08G096500 [Diphasiastrum complanatum]KAJ7547642.1 hypothetical protein O6H91_08G096500 [Diphasiastrum complanatum]KAJ7547643.1 hypothetical protein O6H91_08G096500 [Diphasiastrum complanatum]
MAGTFGSSRQLLMPIIHSQDPNTAFQGSGQMNGHPAMGNVSSIDPLTNHLANMSKHQLYEIMSQMKGLIQQNQHEARLILVANPQLTKALFQAQIMLGMVRPPEASQIQALQQSQSQLPQPLQGPLRQSSASMQQAAMAVTTLSGNVVPQPPTGVYPQPQTSMYPQQAASFASVPVQTSSQQQPRPPAPAPVPASAPNLQPVPSLSTGPTPPPLPPFPPPVQGHPQAAPSMNFQSSPSVQQTLHRPPIQQQGGTPFNMGMVYQQHGQPPLPPQPPPQQTYQTGASIKAPDAFRTDSDRGGAPGIAQSSSHRILSGSNSMGLGPGGPVHVGRGPSYPGGPGAFGSNQVGPFPPSTGSVGGIMVPPNVGPTGLGGSMGSVPPLGTGTTNPPMSGGPAVGGPTFASVSGTGGGIGASAGGVSSGPGFVHPQMYGQVQMQAPPQPQHIPLELEQQKALLQQVMNLTPEQINSLPPEQRQQVIQLQQALR